MSVWDAMKGAWHNHPYLIMGAGGLIVLYFLWPSKKDTGQQVGGSSTDYANQLAAETSLSQAQLAEQTQADIAQWETGAAENAAAAQATAASNSIIAQSNAAAIISYNQTAQGYIAAEGSIANNQTTTNATNFQALVAGLLGFSAGSQKGIADTTNAGLNGYLASIGADFSNTENGNTFVANNSWATQDASGVGIAGLYNLPMYAGQSVSGPAGTIAFNGPGMLSGILGRGGFAPGGQGADRSAAGPGPWIQEATSPFSANENLLGQLWASMITQYQTTAAKPLPVLPFIPGTNAQGQLVGQVQPVPAPIALPALPH